MMTMTLDLTALNNAVARLTEGLEMYERDNAQTIIRDGLIQRFELTYEVAHKTLKRALEVGSPTPEIYDRMVFADLIQSGNEQDLLQGDWPVWKAYRDLRAKSSHTYAEAVALEVLAGIPGFLAEVEFLLHRLREKRLREKF